MKKTILFMVTAIISLFTLSSCIREIRDSINNEQQQDENLAAEQKKSEMTTVDGEALIIYTPSREIKIDPKFKNLGSSESIREAYNKPGKPINFTENYSLNYSPKSLWTRYDHFKEIIRVYYNKSNNEAQSGFIFQQDKTEIKEVLDIAPLLIFLTLLGVSIYSMFCKSDVYLVLIFWLMLLNAVLTYDYLMKFGEFTIFLCLIISVLMALLIIPVFSLFSWLLDFFGGNKIPMPKYKEKTAPDVISYSLIVALIFLIFAKLPISYLPLPFLLFLSPYLIFWGTKSLKELRLLTFSKITRSI